MDATVRIPIVEHSDGIAAGRGFKAQCGDMISYRCPGEQVTLETGELAFCAQRRLNHASILIRTAHGDANVSSSGLGCNERGGQEDRGGADGAGCVSHAPKILSKIARA